MRTGAGKSGDLSGQCDRETQGGWTADKAADAIVPDPAREIWKKEKKITSEEIFENSTTITIVHDGQEYQLRITKANKLILTK